MKSAKNGKTEWIVDQPTTPDENAWRSVIAALANDDARRVFAELVVHQSSPALDNLPAGRRRRVLSALRRADLVAGEDENVAPNESVFRRIIDNAARPQPVGVERFFGQDGRITTYPANLDVRGELLEIVAEKAFVPEETLDEAAVNTRLLPFSDVAVLRRYLVDYGLVARQSSGSGYRLTSRPRGRRIDAEAEERAEPSEQAHHAASDHD
ncbi:DUF2087 domain-containing protein [Schumannella soli]|uniref:DUF2087 domain-containing protein n=1 Tax=Schumannella soli TaxID=2590779 RepID=A0A506XZJ2_9MICO|nr:DUF2087 domain-containing protein [Schumannella soli]TPW75043.1 DUF2087 domain-containing protein [Schumannella soli]